MKNIPVIQNWVLTTLCMVLLYVAGLYIGKDEARQQFEDKDVVCTIKTAMPPVDIKP